MKINRLITGVDRNKAFTARNHLYEADGLLEGLTYLHDRYDYQKAVEDLDGVINFVNSVIGQGTLFVEGEA